MPGFRAASAWTGPPVEHLWDLAAGRPLGRNRQRDGGDLALAASFPRRKRENLVHHLQRCRSVTSDDGSECA